MSWLDMFRAEAEKRNAETRKAVKKARARLGPGEGSEGEVSARTSRTLQQDITKLVPKAQYQSEGIPEGMESRAPGEERRIPAAL